MKRFAALLVLAALTGGCNVYQGPNYMMSLDKHNFVSTPHMPLSLDLQDTLTGENIWHLDIPVGKMAVVDLEHWDDHTAGQSPAVPAYKISWSIDDPGSHVGYLDNTQQLSGHPVMLKVSVRDKAKVAEELAASPPTYTQRDPWDSAPKGAKAPATKPVTTPARTGAGDPSLAPAPIPPQPQYKPQAQPTAAPPSQQPLAPAVIPPQPQFKPAAPTQPGQPTKPKQPTQPGEPNPAADPSQPAGRTPLGADDTGKSK